MRIIVSDYRGNYEWIRTESSLCILTIKIKYLFKGYRIHSTPIWYAKFMMKYFNKRTYQGANVSFEKFDPNKDQITHYSPWDNCY
jgi:hypothetical protein